MSDEPTPFDFLKAVYRDDGLPLNVRMRAAVEGCALRTSKAFGDGNL